MTPFFLARAHTRAVQSVLCRWIVSGEFDLVERARLGERGKLCHRIELPEQLTDDFAGVFAPAQFLHLLKDSAERFFGLRDRPIGVVLAVLLQTLVMFQKLFAKEIGKALAGLPE